MLMSHQGELRALRHRMTRTKQTAFHALALATTRRRWSGVVAHAVALAGMRCLRQSQTMRNALRRLRQWAAAARMAARSRAARTLRSLGVAVQAARDDRDWAMIHWQTALRRKGFKAWRDVAATEVGDHTHTSEPNEQLTYMCLIVASGQPKTPR